MSEQSPTIDFFSLPTLPALQEQLAPINKFGSLIQVANGYTYLKISEDFLKPAIFDCIVCVGKHRPEGLDGGVGAHISLIYETEMPQYFAVMPTVEPIPFALSGVYGVSLAGKNYIVLGVEAPHLEEWRSHYGLSPKPVYKGFEVRFHITLGCF